MIPHKTLNIFSWQDIMQAAKALSVQVYEDGVPDLIVGIPRGGIILATLLAEFLQRDLLSVYVSRRINGIEVQEKPFLKYSIPQEIVSGKSILLVDEIVVTGKTLQEAKKQLEVSGVTQVKTCTLVNRSCGKYVCNYTYTTSHKDCNIFPWDYLVLTSKDTFSVHREYQLIDPYLQSDLYENS